MKKMESRLSQRLNDIVLALPLNDGVRVLEIGCGPGAMAREISRRIKKGHILAIDRSEKAIQQAVLGSPTPNTCFASGGLTCKPGTLCLYLSSVLVVSYVLQNPLERKDRKRYCQPTATTCKPETI
jgi:trans-aconitate methyltransferase